MSHAPWDALDTAGDTAIVAIISHPEAYHVAFATFVLNISTLAMSAAALRRSYDDDPRLAALFTALPGAHWDLSMTSKLFPASVGFSAADVARLTTLGCSTAFDAAAGSQANRFAPVHALHALIRLGEAASPAVPALIERCLRVHGSRSSNGAAGDDFNTEFLVSSLHVALVACGPAAAAPILRAVRAATANDALWRDGADAWLGVSILVDALIDIALRSADVGIASAASDALVEIIEKHFCFIAEHKSLTNTELSGRVMAVRGAVGHASDLAPFLRNEHALLVLRSVRESLEEPAFSWVELLYNMGIEASPLDPAASRLPIPGAAEAAQMWRSWRGDAPPPQAPVPGQPGYKLSSTSKEAWRPAPACGYALCGVDKRIMHDQEALMAAISAGTLETMLSRKYAVDATKLSKCAACGTAVYCSTRHVRRKCGLRVTRIASSRPVKSGSRASY